MHDHIAKTGKFAPGTFLFGGLDLDLQTLARFRQGLQVANHRVLHQAGRVEAFAIGSGVLVNALQALANVVEQ